LQLAERYNLNSEIPLIISAELYHKPYFQYFIKNSVLGKKNWIIQNKKDWIVAQTLFLLKPFPYQKSYWSNTLCLIAHKTDTPESRIFITRTKANGRYLSNMENLLPLLYKYNFSIIDAAKVPFRKQIEIFSAAAVIIGIHGAGNTNVIFADHKYVKFAEIMPADRLACQYYWLTASLGISYNVILGSELKPDNSFELPSEKLESLIISLINI